MTGNFVYTHLNGLAQIREEIGGPLRGNEMHDLPILENAFIVLSNGEVKAYGTMIEFNETEWPGFKIINANGRYIFPAFCDSHTHAVFSGYREQEFVLRIQGATYTEIAEKGGGILNSARKLNSIEENELLEASILHLNKMVASGIGALEIKTGYGLDFENEIKMLKVINKLKEISPIPIRRTFLAAHAIPEAYKNRKSEYVNEIVNHWIPFVEKEGLADFVDVFCEKGYFDPGDVSHIGNAIEGTNLRLKVHVNQFNSIGGVKEAVTNQAISVDHLEVLTPQDLEALKTGKSLTTLLPGCSFFLGIPYAPARTLIESNIPVALASDFNPGSAPSFNPYLIWSLACLKMKMTPEEAFNALTINGAMAMGLGDSYGRIFKGYRGKLILSKPAPSLAYFPYAFGENHTEEMLN